MKPRIEPGINFRIDEAIDLLSRTPDVVRALLADLPSEWLAADEGPETWTPVAVLAHLIHGEETDWIPRARIILESSGGGMFPPFDMHGHSVHLKKPVGVLLDTFQRIRREGVSTLQGFNLTEVDLDQTGIHPEFGPVALRQHLATWVAHDLDHLVQIARVMAKRYSSDVGPWKQYLSVLRERR